MNEAVLLINHALTMAAACFREYPKGRAYFVSAGLKELSSCVEFCGTSVFA